MARVPTRPLLALVAIFAMVGAATPTLAGCASFLEAAAVGQPSCCGTEAEDRGIEVSALRGDCCRDGSLRELDATVVSSGAAPDVPPAAAVTVPIALLAVASASDLSGPSARGALDRPAVSARIKATSVLLI